MSDPDGRVFHANGARRLGRAARWIVGAGVVLVLVAGAGVVAGSPVVIVLAGLGATVLVCVVLIALTSIATVTISGKQVELRRWPARRTRLPVDHELRGLLAPFLSTLVTSARRRLVLRHPRSRRRIALMDAWADQDLAEMASLLGVDATSDPLDARGWQARAPGLLPWAVRHVFVAIAAGVLAFWVVVIAVVGIAG